MSLQTTASAVLLQLAELVELPAEMLVLGTDTHPQPLKLPLTLAEQGVEPYTMLLLSASAPDGAGDSSVDSSLGAVVEDSADAAEAQRQKLRASRAGKVAKLLGHNALDSAQGGGPEVLGAGGVAGPHDSHCAASLQRAAFEHLGRALHAQVHSD